MNINMTTEQARELSRCPGCFDPKPLGMIVCLSCFKYRQDRTPLKYFAGSLAEWLQKIHAARTLAALVLIAVVHFTEQTIIEAPQPQAPTCIEYCGGK